MELISYWEVPGDREKCLSKGAGEPADRMFTEVFTDTASPCGTCAALSESLICSELFKHLLNGIVCVCCPVILTVC